MGGEIGVAVQRFANAHLAQVVRVLGQRRGDDVCATAQMQ